MEKIDGQQLDKLIGIILKHGISLNVIEGLLNIENLTDLDTRKYNLLLMLIYQITGEED